MVSNSVEVKESRNESLLCPPGEPNGQTNAGSGATDGRSLSRDDLAVDVSNTTGTASMAEDEASPVSIDLRRRGSKIANLRTAFEKQTEDGMVVVSPIGSIKHLERTTSRSKEHDTEIAKWKEQHDMQLTKTLEDHSLEIAKLRADHTTTLEKEEDLRQAYEEKCTNLEEELEALQTKLSKQDIEWQLEMEKQCNHLHRERNQAQEETRTLQRQLFELKKGISSATRIEHQISDSEFAQHFTQFFFETQNWVVNNFRKTKIETTPEEMCTRLGSIAEGSHLEYLNPIFEHYDSSIKLAAFQATVACYMMEIFNDSLLFGIPSEPSWRKGISMAMETLPELLPPIAFNKWRAMTLDTLAQCKNDEMRESIETASRNMSEMICITLNTLTEAEESEARIVSLDAILKRAVALAHIFRVQRPRYEFKLPPPGTTFDPSAMEDISVDGEGWHSEKGIRFAAYPCVIKHGDEQGNCMELSNVIVRSRVLCG